MGGRPGRSRGGEGEQRQERRDEVAVGRRHREGWREGGSHDGRDQEHHAEMAKGVEKEQRGQRGWKRKRRQSRRYVEAGDEGIPDEVQQYLKPEDCPRAQGQPPSARPCAPCTCLRRAPRARSLSSWTCTRRDIDASENLPKEAPRQVALGQLEFSRDENRSLAEIHHHFVTDPEPIVLILLFDSTGSSVARS